MTARRLAHRPQAVKLSRKGKSMVKLVALLKAKEGLSQEEFENYYEQYHVPLVLKHLPQIAHYRRNYVVPDPLLRTQHMSSDATPPEFNVLTESWISQKNTYDIQSLLRIS